MQITVNGETLEVEDSASLEVVLKVLGQTSPTGVAAAVNNEVVPRSQWGSARLKSKDRILIITAAQGG